MAWTTVDPTSFVMASDPIYAGVSRRGRGEWAWHVSREYTWLRSGTCRTKAAALAKAKTEFKAICAVYADKIAARCA